MPTLEKDTLHIKTISELLRIFNLEAPKNPLITILNTSTIPFEFLSSTQDYVLDFYLITMKDNANGFYLGKKNFNFDDGELSFNKPSQTLNLSFASQLNHSEGWVLLFHNDLLKSTPLFDKINDYRFFDYTVDQALTLDNNEQNSINQCLSFIGNEINSAFDNHSSNVVSSILEVMLNLCNRFFERQFDKQALQNNHIVSKIDTFLKLYYDNDLFSEKGIPDVNQIAAFVNLSPNYLSNLLKKETGKNTKDYINYFIIEKSKNLLLNKREYSISELSYKLGFNYPHYFSRFFKSKTGVTPLQYRK